MQDVDSSPQNFTDPYQIAVRTKLHLLSPAHGLSQHSFRVWDAAGSSYWDAFGNPASVFICASLLVHRFSIQSRMRTSYTPPRFFPKSSTENQAPTLSHSSTLRCRPHQAPERSRSFRLRTIERPRLIFSSTLRISQPSYLTLLLTIPTCYTLRRRLH